MFSMPESDDDQPLIYPHSSSSSTSSYVYCCYYVFGSQLPQFLFYQSKASRARSLKRAGSESSQESLSLPPPSPADAHLMGAYPPPSPHPLSSPDPGHTMLVGSTDPMLSMPPPSPLADCLLPTVLGSPPLLVSDTTCPPPACLPQLETMGLGGPGWPVFSSPCFASTFDRLQLTRHPRNYQYQHHH